MFSAPENLKFKKFHKIKINYLVTEQRLFCSKFGDYGLQALSSGKVNAKQIEAGRRVIRRFSKKQAFLKIDIFPFASLTKKPTSARMGKGKGKTHTWICPVNRGRILFEISSLGSKFNGSLPLRALRLVNKKLSIKSRPVKLIY